MAIWSGTAKAGIIGLVAVGVVGCGKKGGGEERADTKATTEAGSSKAAVPGSSKTGPSGQPTGGPAQATRDEAAIRKLVQDLAVPATRDATRTELINIGAGAVPAMTEAAKAWSTEYESQPKGAARERLRVLRDKLQPLIDVSKSIGDPAKPVIRVIYDNTTGSGATVSRGALFDMGEKLPVKD